MRLPHIAWRECRERVKRPRIDAHRCRHGSRWRSTHLEPPACPYRPGAPARLWSVLSGEALAARRPPGTESVLGATATRLGSLALNGGVQGLLSAQMRTRCGARPESGYC